MLRGLFDLDNPVMRFLSKVADVLTLNLLFLLCSIPVFTIGASTTALYYCFFKMKDNEEEQITYEELDENTIEIEDGIVNNGSIGLEIEDDIISEG